jgi:hypothetical protein
MVICGAIREKHKVLSLAWEEIHEEPPSHCLCQLGIYGPTITRLEDPAFS